LASVTPALLLAMPNGKRLVWYWSWEWTQGGDTSAMIANRNGDPGHPLGG